MPDKLCNGSKGLGNDYLTAGMDSIFVPLTQRHLYQIFLLWALFVSVSPEAKTQVYAKAKNLTTQDGLSDNRITCIYKDKKGFVWIGTRNGLNRYDGHRIVTFRPTAGNSISNEIINDIAEDSRGDIWVATMNGLNRYDPIANHWEVFLPLTKVSDDDIPSNLVWDIHIDKKDRVWIASDVRQFSYYDIGTKKFIYFDWPGFVKNNPQHFSNGSYNSIKRFTWKNENEVWLATNKALVLLDIARKSFSYLGGNYRSEIYDLRYDAGHRKVYWTIEGGKLLSWDESKAEFREARPQPEPYPSTNFRLPSGDEIWMAAENGLVQIEASQNQTFLSRHIPQLSGSLQPGSVSAVLQHADGIGWVGTSNGISMYDVSGAKSYFLPLLPVSDKESINSMGGVYYDPQRDIYFVCAANASAVFLVHKKTGAIQRLATDAAGAPFFHCNTIKADNENNIWLLTDNNVYRFDDSRNAFIRFPMPNNNGQVLFRDMVQDADGNYWFGSFHNGLYYYQSKEKRFVKPQGDGFDHISTATALYADHRRRKVWIGTFSLGFYCYDLAQKKLTAYLETDQYPEYSALNLVQDITQDGAGSVWAATHSGGLFRFTDTGKGKHAVRHYHMKSGLPDNSFLALTSNDDSLIWALSGKGLSTVTTSGRVPSQFNSSQHFSFSSYLSDVRWPHKIFYNKANEELLVGVGGGLLIYPTRLTAKAGSIPLVITGISVNERQLAATEKSKTDKVVLPFNENSLAFDFAMLYYGAREAVKLEYRLNGWDDHWLDANGNFSAVYQNLSPGNYRFELRAKRQSGTVVGDIQSLSLQIKPPFWQRWWAVTVGALLLAFLIYSLVKRRINAIKRKAALQQQLAELEGKALRAQMNPHFIFNSLNAIQELIVTQNVDAAYDYLSKFSKLLRLVLNNSEKSAILLSDELHMLQLYLELESLRFRKAFHYTIHVSSALDPESLAVPPLLLQPFIENALWHGLMLKEGEKKLQISIDRKDELIVCVIEDNGIGRQRAAEIKAQKIGASHFESKGLKLSQQRIELLKAEGANGFVKIEDLYESDHASGTRVSVHLPFIHA